MLGYVSVGENPTMGIGEPRNPGDTFQGIGFVLSSPMKVFFKCDCPLVAKIIHVNAPCLQAQFRPVIGWHGNGNERVCRPKLLSLGFGWESGKKLPFLHFLAQSQISGTELDPDHFGYKLLEGWNDFCFGSVFCLSA